MRHKAARTDGAAAADATQRKVQRSGHGVGGVQVITVAVETWGRLGEDATELPAQLAGHWATASSAGSAAAAATLRRWRSEMGVALVRSQAATAAQAAPTRCADDAAYESGSDAPSCM